jgi:hypothetical protein
MDSWASLGPTAQLYLRDSFMSHFPVVNAISEVIQKMVSSYMEIMSFFSRITQYVY